MILVDLNQVMISNLMAQIGSHTNIDLDENLLRHMVLNALRGYKNKFSNEYGELVICCDSTNIWRKDVYPYYKAHRKKARQDSDLDWSSLFESLNKIRDELKEFFPYKHIQIDKAEADDIIGVICHEHGAVLGDGAEKILIMSGDKDFAQLQIHTNVYQYDPVRKRKLRHDKPESYLVEHILKGDRGDGIPNVLSQDDCFVAGIRQKPLRQTVINKITEAISALGGINNVDGSTEEWVPNFIRNRELVDLNRTPEYLRSQVLEEFNKPTQSRGKLFNYFIKSKLTNLMESISEF
jgi:hypothetical protein|tara:strand:+ start:3126 stop:4007 length:882 start_codon:yes stop_codon:yes gene_type:complete